MLWLGEIDSKSVEDEEKLDAVSYWFARAFASADAKHYVLPAIYFAASYDARVQYYYADGTEVGFCSSLSTIIMTVSNSFQVRFVFKGYNLSSQDQALDFLRTL